MLIHQGDEPVVVMPLHQMRQFVDDDVFKALRRLLGEFEIQPDTPGFRIAGSPAWFSSS